MELRKKIVILMALLLAAMAMVPMVNALEKNSMATPVNDFATATVNISKIQLPHLVYDTKQNPVNVTTEMSLDQNIQSVQVTTQLAGKQSHTTGKVPYGTIIHHSTDGITTVFDSTGKQLFMAKDANAAIINTMNGPAPATYIQEVPDKSVIVDSGKIIYVFSNKALILTIINENSGNTHATVKAATASYPRQYIEGTETNILPTLGQFIADWNVPQSPAQVSPYPASGNPWQGSQITIWNGVFGFVGSDPDSRLLQPVLEWYKKDQVSDPTPAAAWTMATWYVGTGTVPDYIHATRRTLVYSGDSVRGNIQLNTLGYDAIAAITDLGPEGGGSSTLFLTKTTIPKRMPNTNVQATVVLEGWDPVILPGLNGQYMCGCVTFQNFVLNDNNGNSILSTPMNNFINSNYWNPTTFGLNIVNSWPSSIRLNTINT